MAFVVTEPCVGCKYTDCVTVCPMECFHDGEHMLFIDPVDCIDCEACVPECPIEAIFHEDSVPAQWRHFIALNAEGARRYPIITEKQGGSITTYQLYRRSSDAMGVAAPRHLG